MGGNGHRRPEDANPSVSPHEAGPWHRSVEEVQHVSADPKAMSTGSPRHTRSVSPSVSSTSDEAGHGEEEEKEPKKRRRIQQACKSCSLRRVKCNGEKPCQTCVKNREICEYGIKKKRGPAKGTIRAPRGSRPRTTSSGDATHSAWQEPRRTLSGSHLASTSALPFEPREPAFLSKDRIMGIQSNGNYLPTTRSVYLGDTSGYGYSVAFQDPARNEQHRTSQMRQPYPYPYPADTKPPFDPAPSAPQRQLNTFMQSSYVHSRLPERTLPSRSSMQGEQPVFSDDRRQTTHQLPLADFETSDASLIAIFHDLYERKGKAVGRQPDRGGAAALEDDEITLTHPVISDETKAELFHFFWTNILQYWPMLLRKAFPNEAVARTTVENDHPFLFNAICALAAMAVNEKFDAGSGRYHPPIMTPRQLSNVFYARARYYNVSTIFNPSLEAAAALVLLALRASGTGHSSAASKFCYSACRMALELGLHRDGELSQSLPRNLDKIESESRRRVYWSAYVLDKILAAQLGRPPVLRWQECDCPFPSCTDDDRSSVASPYQARDTVSHEVEKETTSYFNNGCRLAIICESIIEQYNIIRSKQDNSQQPPGNATVLLHHRLKRWMAETPQHMQWRPNQDARSLPYTLHQQAWSQVLMILIHRPYILKGCGDASINSHAECSRATENICGIFRDIERLHSFRDLPSSAIYCLFTATTIALANTTSTDMEMATLAKSQLAQCTQWFAALAQSWSSASQHLYILQRLASAIDPVFAKEAISVHRRSSQDNSLAFHTPPSPSTWQSVGAESYASVTSPQSMRKGSSSTSMSRGGESRGSGQSFAHAQSIDTFWNDMPLGEDFARWNAFAQTYFKASNEDEIPPETIERYEGSFPLQQSRRPSLPSLNSLPPPPPSPYSTSARSSQFR